MNCEHREPAAHSVSHIIWPGPVETCSLPVETQETLPDAVHQQPNPDKAGNIASTERERERQRQRESERNRQTQTETKKRQREIEVLYYSRGTTRLDCSA